MPTEQVPTEMIQAEVDFIVKVITHPVGYTLDLFGVMSIRPTDQGVWCVSWEEYDFGIYQVEECFETPEEAANFFIHKRLENKLGLPFEKT